jgi:hypothetical protein
MRSIGVKGIVGVVLLILGASWLLLIVLNFTITETVIDTAFVLEPGEKYGGWEDREMLYWTRGFPVLTGNVSVEGGGIDFTVDGHVEGLMESIFVDNYFNFTIGPPTSDFYLFTFDNTGGNATSHVEFVLNETLTESLTFRIMRSFGPRFSGGLLWMCCLFGAFVSLAIGFVLILWSLLARKKEKNHSQVVPPNTYAARAD